MTHRKKPDGWVVPHATTDPAIGRRRQLTKELRFRGLRPLQRTPAQAGLSREAVLELIEESSLAGA